MSENEGEEEKPLNSLLANTRKSRRIFLFSSAVLGSIALGIGLRQEEAKDLAMPGGRGAAAKVNALRADADATKKELQNIRKELQNDLADLRNGMDAELKKIEDILLEGDKDLKPLKPKDTKSLDSMVRAQVKGSEESIVNALKEVEESLLDEKMRREVRGIKSEFMQKQIELASELRSTAYKVNDKDLQQQLLQEAMDLLEIDPTRPLSLKEKLRRQWSSLQGVVEEKVLKNEDMLKQLDQVLPFDLYKKEIKGDAEYITFPLFGGMTVEKATLSPLQVLQGGLLAGAAGEILKDCVSFPMDTIRTRLMTQGSFLPPKHSPEASEEEDFTEGQVTVVEGPEIDLTLYTKDVGRGTVMINKPREDPRRLIKRLGEQGSAMVSQALKPYKVQLQNLQAWRRGERIWNETTVTLRRGERIWSETTRIMNTNFWSRLPIKVPQGLFNDVYRGVTPVLLASPIQGAFFFGAKDVLKKVMPASGFNPTQTFLAGIVLADSVYWLVRCPAETVKTRVQTGLEPNFVESAKTILMKEGLYGFYRGYIPLLQLDFPFTILNFALFTAYQGLVSTYFGHEPTISDQFVGGFICSAITAGLTCPLSVASTRILMDSGGNDQEEEEEEEKEKEPVYTGAAAGDKSSWTELKTWIEEGIHNISKDSALAEAEAAEGEDAANVGVMDRLALASEKTIEFFNPGKEDEQAGKEGQASPAGARKAEGAKSRRYTDMLGTMKTIVEEEGIRALFKGVVPRVLQLGLNHAIRFSGYQASRDVLVHGMLEGDLDRTLIRMFTGGFLPK
ncbi:hypothetical protein GUITHDRAFT_107986 [Guillardia theta CCMP2712]|uniref:Uncharacterized protein n=2 Tax=Guillardia theta TaxID=55529 RepID=L1JCX1_GUITC|nr:hypothetical protein GUITHDRAFT_107986 [Guillardia theta CCMP2712]EKX45950.1 hypothetical protein GUITHDRAFT_107986 [Guillardia theta CCMP2712]|eukprot:XP_005832930.1 hypothetical protein GUITHDRAFT_107986 [Guillardia theta CCMP2712]